MVDDVKKGSEKMNEIAEKPTLTMHELYIDMRRCGLTTSEPKIKAMIQQGKYPFAVSCEMCHTEFEIYRKLYNEWKEKVGLKYID